MLPILGEVTNSAAALLGFVYLNSNRFLFPLPNVNLANAKRFRYAYWAKRRERRECGRGRSVRCDVLGPWAPRGPQLESDVSLGLFLRCVSSNIATRAETFGLHGRALLFDWCRLLKK